KCSILVQAEILHRSRNDANAITRSLFAQPRKQIRARKVLLATGVIDVEPAFPGLDDAVHRGLVRHCPICDGYEVIGKKVAVIAQDTEALKEALFIRTYTADLTLFTLGHSVAFSEEDRQKLTTAGITVIEDGIPALRME
ncbi:hypothetical protein QMN58_30020, partial [Escherichia coli]|nr:hypothetical protein [Escherichia coli]